MKLEENVVFRLWQIDAQKLLKTIKLKHSVTKKSISLNEFNKLFKKYDIQLGNVARGKRTDNINPVLPCSKCRFNPKCDGHRFNRYSPCYKLAKIIQPLLGKTDLKMDYINYYKLTNKENQDV